MSHVRRGSTTGGVWPNAVLENAYERPSNDPETLETWCHTDRLTPIEGDRLRLIAILSFMDQPGVMFSPEDRVQFYGRAG